MPDYVFSDYRPLYLSIARAVGTADFSSETTPGGQPIPRKQYVNALKVNLTSPGMQVFCSHSEETGQYTVPQFAAAKFTGGRSALVAWNGNYFDPNDAETIYGLAISNGVVVNLPEPADDPPCPWSLVFTRPGRPDSSAGVYQFQPGDPPPPAAWAAVSGNALLVRDGINVAVDSDSTQTTAARTTAGVSQDGQTLFVVTIDGDETDATPYGASLVDAGEWLVRAGAWWGVNLDGGGSTTVARIDAGTAGQAALMNVPFGREQNPGVERVVGLCFGVAVVIESA